MAIRIILFLTTIMNLHSQDKYWEKTRDKKEYISTLKQTNWFDSRPDSVQEKILKSINELDNNHLCLALSDISFDAEGFWNYRHYKELTEKLFRLLNIQAEISGSGKDNDSLIKLNIKIDSIYKEFEFDKKQNGNWIDDEYLNEINSMLNAYSKEQIITLPATDQIIDCIIISNSEYSNFIKKGLIPKKSDYLIQIEFNE